MTFKDSFCSSPWFHMRINAAGHYEYCRWADKADRNSGANIQDIAPAEYFQNNMQEIRQQLVDGKSIPGCRDCYLMDGQGKISGRQKQLLKVGVRLEEFEKTLVSSPWVPVFANSKFQQMPQDWQIDLGNFCNSACVFCHPHSSSKLAAEWKRIGFIDQVPRAAWAEDPALVDRFLQSLKSCGTIKYIHFIGGETVITPAFKKILRALVESGLHKTITVGFTTNLISWDDEVVELLTQFHSVNLGMSIETLTPVNDYIRWPSTLPQVLATLEQWRQIAARHQWFMQIRTTPTVLSLFDLLSVYEYALPHNITVESCNFIDRPEFMRPSVLPQHHRQELINKFTTWIEKNYTPGELVVNIRNPNTAKQQIVQDLESYVNYLKNAPDESHRLPDLTTFLKRLETSRGNCILDYLPEYEELFRSAGY